MSRDLRPVAAKRLPAGECVARRERLQNRVQHFTLPLLTRRRVHGSGRRELPRGVHVDVLEAGQE